MGHNIRLGRVSAEYDQKSETYKTLKKLVCEIKGYACLTGSNALESMHTSIDLTVERI